MITRELKTSIHLTFAHIVYRKRDVLRIGLIMRDSRRNPGYSSTPTTIYVETKRVNTLYVAENSISSRHLYSEPNRTTIQVSQYGIDTWLHCRSG